MYMYGDVSDKNGPHEEADLFINYLNHFVTPTQRIFVSFQMPVLGETVDVLLHISDVLQRRRFYLSHHFFSCGHSSMVCGGDVATVQLVKRNGSNVKLFSY